MLADSYTYDVVKHYIDKWWKIYNIVIHTIVNHGLNIY